MHGWFLIFGLWSPISLLYIFCSLMLGLGLCLPCFNTPFPAGFLMGPDNKEEERRDFLSVFQVLSASPQPPASLSTPCTSHAMSSPETSEHSCTELPCWRSEHQPCGPLPWALTVWNPISALCYLSPKGGKCFPWVTSLYSFFPSFSLAKPILTITCISFFYLKYLVWFLLYWLVLKCYSFILIS